MHWCIPQENKIAQDSPSNFANQHLLHQILGYFLTIGFTEQPHWRKLTPWNLPISFIDTSNSKKTMNPQNLYVSEPNEKETLRNIFIPTMVLWPQTLKKNAKNMIQHENVPRWQVFAKWTKSSHLASADTSPTLRRLGAVGIPHEHRLWSWCWFWWGWGCILGMYHVFIEYLTKHQERQGLLFLLEKS